MASLNSHSPGSNQQEQLSGLVLTENPFFSVKYWPFPVQIIALSHKICSFLGANIDNSYHQLIINDPQLINYYHLREEQKTPHCPNDFFPDNTRKYILKIIVNDLESASFISVINYKHGLKTDTKLWTCIFNKYYTPTLQKHFSHHFPQINVLQEPKLNLI